MKKNILFLFLLVTATTPIIAQTNPNNKTKTKTILNPTKPSILVKDLPQTNVDIQWKLSLMVKVHGGTFFRNTSTFNPQITISSFYISKYEVTFNQYDAFCTATGRTKPGDNGWGRGNRPVINVSYIDALDYCKWLGDSIKRTVRLPTEAEWEYAAVGITGTFTISENGYYFGSSATKGSGFQYSGLFKYGYNPDSVAWYRGNTGKTMPVGTKAPNKYSLYDMTGSVREWCHDMYSPDLRGIADHYTYPVRPNNPTGPPGDIRSYAQRVIRGGGYRSDSLGCRLGVRQKASYENRSTDLGFRFVYDCTDCRD